MKLVFLPPVLAQNRVIRTPRITQKQCGVMLIHVQYTQSSYFVLFSQFRFYLGLYLLKNSEIGVFTPVFGPKKGHNDP